MASHPNFIVTAVKTSNGSHIQTYSLDAERPVSLGKE